MQQRPVQSFMSRPYLYVVDYLRSHGLALCSSHDSVTSEPTHGSFNEGVPFHNFSRAQWNPPCGSPLSTSSSISHSESVPTPLYTGLPMYDPVEQPFQSIQDDHITLTRELEPMWQPTYTEPHVSLCHSGPSYEPFPLHPVQSYLPPVDFFNATPFLGFTEPPPPYSRGQAIDSLPSNQGHTNSNSMDSSGGSDSDSDNSDYDDDCSRKFSHSTSTGSHGSMKLGRWAPPMDTFANTTEQRHYYCNLVNLTRTHRCPKKFLRPEHLRRHIKTVHSSDRPYVCKVSQCGKAFSRGDNLRDHYWTHLSRGGRAGKNQKMGFLELKAILGPKEKKLARRLKIKLKKQREKQMKARL
jgi:uncharacterized Zn-finger protein